MRGSSSKSKSRSKSTSSMDDQFHSKFYCPITGKVMNDPMVDYEGNVYDGPTILEWVRKYGTSPITGEAMSIRDVKPHDLLRSQLKEIRDRQGGIRKKLFQSMGKAMGRRKSLDDGPQPDYDAIKHYRALHPPQSYNRERYNVIGDTLSSLGSSESKSYSSGESGSAQSSGGGSLASLSSLASGSLSSNSKKPKSALSKGRSGHGPDQVPSRRKVNVLDTVYEDKQTKKEAKKAKQKPAAKEKAKKVPKTFYNSMLSAWDLKRNIGSLCCREDPGRRKRDIAMAYKRRILDGIIALAFLWQLNAAMVQVFSLNLMGFQDWVEDSGGFVYAVSATEDSSSLTVFFVLLGYMTSKIFISQLNYSPDDVLDPNAIVDAESIADIEAAAIRQKKSEKQKKQLTYTGFCLIRTVPALWAAILVAIICGACSTDDVIRQEFYENCKESWWTNVFFVTNLSLLWSQRTVTVSDVTDDYTVIANADASTCYPSLWAISCAAQLVLFFLPTLMYYNAKPSKGLSLTIFWLVAAVVSRSVISAIATNADEFTLLVYYTPWGRADAFAIGALVFMSEIYSEALAREEATRKPLGFYKYEDDTGPVSLCIGGFTSFLEVQFKALFEFMASWFEPSKKSGRPRYRHRSDEDRERDPLIKKSSKKAKNGKATKKKRDKEKGSYVGLDDTLLEERRKEKAQKDALKALEEGNNEEMKNFENHGENHDSDDDSMGNEGSVSSESESQSGQSQASTNIFSQYSSLSKYTTGTFLSRYLNSLASGTEMTMTAEEEEAELAALEGEYRYIGLEDARSSVSHAAYKPLTMAQWLAMMRGTLFATILLGFCLYWSVGTNVDNIPGWANINSEWQYRNVTLLSTAAATGSLLYIALDGSFAPLQFFLAMPIWQPFSSLSYTGYLLQIIIVNAVCTVSTRHTLEWDGDMWDYTANYLVVLLANLMAACLLSIAIERPVINMFTQTGFEYT